MSSPDQYGDVHVALEGHIAKVTIRRPPHNFFDVTLIRDLVSAYRALDQEPGCRVIVLSSEGKSFCAGAQLEGANVDRSTADGAVAGRRGSGHLYQEAIRLFAAETPVVAAVQGAAIGGGLGLALSADFRVGCPESRLAANFSRLGFHQGFGLTVTLPRLVGQQKALELLYTGRRVKGDEAFAIGLCDELVEADRLLERAVEMATEIARSAPLAVRSIRRTMRRGLVEALESATDRELVEQNWLRETDDFKEGVKAMADRRLPDFEGA